MHDAALDSKFVPEISGVSNLIALTGDVPIREEFGEPRLEIEGSEAGAESESMEDVKCAINGMQQDKTRQDKTRQDKTRQDKINSRYKDLRSKNWRGQDDQSS